MTTQPPLLEVENLEKHYSVTKGVLRREVGRVRAVDGISFAIDRGEAFGLVGESGCGKSTAATTLLHVEEPTGGTVRFDGEDVSTYGNGEFARFRRRTGMVFQDPDSSLDPRMSVGESIAEPLVVHGMAGRSRRRERVEALLERVGLEAADADRYPHEQSGGQKQRVGLARALSADPDLLIADEPVSALDVSVQAEILSVISDLQTEFDLAVLLISHDLGVVREVCDRVGVMYLGELVETGPTEAIFEDPNHPYTRALIDSIPTPDPHDRQDGVSLTGTVPSASDPPQGCRFHTRCPELIQPTGYDLDQEGWRSIAKFTRQVAEKSIDPNAIGQAVVAGNDVPADCETGTLEAFDERIRAEYGLPDPVSSQRGESALREAIEWLYDGDTEKAGTLLSAEFETVCRREPPPSTDVGADTDHCVSCHLATESITRECKPDATWE
ncbi:ABC transporter ATP-binding protein [Natrialbaceae archaeon A-gly3]